MKFALDTEEAVTNFYKSAAESATDPELVDLFGDLADRGLKRTKTLMRIRRENTTEMILEPIVGLNSESYDLTASLSDSADDAVLRELAASIESKLHQFYMDAASKIDFLSEAAYLLELLAEKNEEFAQRLHT
jgi:rubrerythrin